MQGDTGSGTSGEGADRLSHSSLLPGPTLLMCRVVRCLQANTGSSRLGDGMYSAFSFVSVVRCHCPDSLDWMQAGSSDDGEDKAFDFGSLFWCQ